MLRLVKRLSREYTNSFFAISLGILGGIVQHTSYAMAEELSERCYAIIDFAKELPTNGGWDGQTYRIFSLQDITKHCDQCGFIGSPNDCVQEIRSTLYNSYGIEVLSSGWVNHRQSPPICPIECAAGNEKTKSSFPTSGATAFVNYPALDEQAISIGLHSQYAKGSDRALSNLSSKITKNALKICRDLKRFRKLAKTEKPLPQGCR